MLTLIHGDNIVLSRNELVKLKNTVRDKEIRDINGLNISENELRQAVESLSLFGNTLCIVIENLFSPLGKKELITKQFGAILKEASASVDIILWEPKELGKTAQQAVSGAKIQLYKMPLVLFDFLDGLMPNKTNELLTIFAKTTDSVPVELIGYMLGTRVRQLIQIKDDVVPERTSPWQRMHLTNQAKSFTMDKLLAMHTRLMEIEYTVKTGSSPFTLEQHIKQFILEF